MFQDIFELVNKCRVNLDNIIELSNNYALMHDEYIITNIKDSTELKRLLKEKVVGVLDENY
jgi:hypothetical protein